MDLDNDVRNVTRATPIFFVRGPQISYAIYKVGSPKFGVDRPSDIG